ncbi:MAG: hypothetical protein ABJD68_03245, partial [Nakamurella sp.]
MHLADGFLVRCYGDFAIIILPDQGPSALYCHTESQQFTRWIKAQALKQEICKEYDDNYNAYGARKMWLTLRGEGIDVAR